MTSPITVPLAGLITSLFVWFFLWGVFDKPDHRITIWPGVWWVSSKRLWNERLKDARDQKRRYEEALGILERKLARAELGASLKQGHEKRMDKFVKWFEDGRGPDPASLMPVDLTPGATRAELERQVRVLGVAVHLMQQNVRGCEKEITWIKLFHGTKLHDV